VARARRHKKGANVTLTEITYALMRMFFGAAVLCHGLQKLFGWLGAQAAASDPLRIAAGVVVLTAGTLIALGVRVGIIGWIASGEMAVAYIRTHGPRGPWPIMNGGELAVLYCFGFLYMASRGSGRFSVDALTGTRTRRR
jgi:putative oxidoreductase